MRDVVPARTGTAAGLANLRFVPGLSLLVVVAILAADDGGYATTAWYPAALFVLALVGIEWFGGGRWAPRTGAAVALAAFVALCAWSYASIGWSTVRGDAWTGANRTFLYLLAFALMARWGRHRVGAAMWIILLPLALATVGATTLVRAATTDTPRDLLVGSRLADPTGYPNATAAIFLLGVWPALALSTHRRIAPWLRGLLLASAGTLLELSVIPQSRGAVYTFPVVAAIFLLIVPSRLRACGQLVLIVAAAGASSPSLLHVYHAASTGGDLHAAFRNAAGAILASAVALALVGTGLAVVDARWQRSPRTTRRLRAVAAVLAVMLVAGSAAYGVAVTHHPVRRVEATWRAFKHGGEPTSTTTHFSGLGSNRYDFWRVAWNVFRAHPYAGVGVDNYSVQYLQHRRSFEQPRYPHSVIFRLLVGTGVVGLALFALFVGASASGFVRRPEDDLRRLVQAAGAAVFVSWLVHGTVDWLWEFPALSIAAFGSLGLAVAQSGVGGSTGLPSRLPAARIAVATVAAVLFCGSAVAFGATWLGDREVNLAAGQWRLDEAKAQDRLATAARLEPLSDAPWLVAGAIATKVRDFPAARRYYLRALGRNPRNWYAHLEAGVLEAALGHDRAALAQLSAAKRLNPREGVIQFALDRQRSGHPVPPAEIDRDLLAEFGSAFN